MEAFGERGRHFFEEFLFFVFAMLAAENLALTPILLRSLLWCFFHRDG